MNLSFLNTREKVRIFASYCRADTAGYADRVVDQRR
jgi:hypothetical protein